MSRLARKRKEDRGAEAGVVRETASVQFRHVEIVWRKVEILVRIYLAIPPK